MNINMQISFKDLLDPNSDPLIAVGDFEENMFLDPFYATEFDIMTPFGEEVGTYRNTIRSIIFDCSIHAMMIFTPERVSYLQLTTEQAFMFKRQFVICSAIYKFADIFFKDYLKSINKSKFLADFKVSLSVEKDPSLVSKILADAKECADEIAALMQIGFNFETFSKGSNNIYNLQRPYREWWPSNGNNTPTVSIATTKATDFIRVYKIGSNSTV